MFSKKNSLLFLGLVVIFVVIRSSWDRQVATWEDFDIARNLYNEGEFYYHSDGARNHTFQFPAYPSILAFLFLFTGVNPFTAIVFNILIHILSAFLLYRLFQMLNEYFLPLQKQKVKNSIALMAVMAFLSHPALIMYAFFHVHPITLNIFTIFLGLYFSLRAAFDPSRKNLLLAGVVIGFAMLDRATSLLTLIPAVLIWTQHFSITKSVAKAAEVVCIIAIVLAPWLIRNYVVDGIIGFESSAAKNKWKGVLYNSEGGNYLLDGENYYSALTVEEKWSLGEMSPIEQRDFFNSKYNEILKNDPGHAVKMFFIKLKNFWWFRSHAGEEWGNMQKYLLMYKAIYFLMLVSTLLFLIRFWKRAISVFSFLLALSFLQAYFYVETRHRIAIEPLLIYFSFVIPMVYIYNRFTEEVIAE